MGGAVQRLDAEAAIVRLDDACKALAEARSLDEAKLIRDQAEAFRHYAQRRGLGRAAMLDAAEIKLRAERRLGEMLAAMPKHNGDPLSHDVTRVSDLGITRMDSHRWQRSLAVPEEAFERYIEGARADADKRPPTTAGVLRLAKTLAQPGRGEGGDPGCCTVDDLDSLILAGRKFGTVYADPPWRYGNQGTRAATDDHYKTMSVDDIAALPVGELAAECCHLHLWTTNAFLFECPRLFEAWGFKYQGVFVWCKPQMGIGNCWRVSHEFLVLAIRGEPRSFAAKNLMSWAAISREEHSVKPGQVRAMVERASPGPRLELFGRKAHPGWVVWGDEIARDLFHRPGETA